MHHSSLPGGKAMMERGLEKRDFTPAIKKIISHKVQSTHMDALSVSYVLFLLNLTSQKTSDWNLSLQEIVSKKLHN